MTNPLKMKVAAAIVVAFVLVVLGAILSVILSIIKSVGIIPALVFVGASAAVWSVFWAFGTLFGDQP